MCLRRKKRGESKVLSRRFRLRDSESAQRALRFLNIHCSNVNSYSSAPGSNRPNPPDRTVDLPFFFRYKHITSLNLLKASLCPHQMRVDRTDFKATLRLRLF